jgi:hypothetical protein
MNELAPQSLLYRARAASGEYRRESLHGQGLPDQAVFKVIGSRSSASGAHDLIAYVSRSGQWGVKYKREAPIVLRDEVGEDWPRVPLTDYWDLPDELALAARRLRRDLAAPGLERRPPALVWHLVVSVRRDAGWHDAGEDGWAWDGGARAGRELTQERLEEAGRGFVVEAFATEGWRVLWTPHDDGQHPHLHLIVRAENDHGGKLRFDKHGELADEFREIFVRHARDCGLDIAAERREDRSEVRRAVLAGATTLRTGQSMARIKQGRRDLAEQAPDWYIAEGAGYETRRIEDASRRLRAAHLDTGAERRSAYAAQLPPAPARSRGKPAAGAEKKQLTGILPVEQADWPGFSALAEHIAGSFTDPEAAMRSFTRLCTEGAHVAGNGSVRYPKRSLAIWYMKHQPIAFGDITAASLHHRKDRALAGLLKQTRPQAGYAPVASNAGQLEVLREQANATRAASSAIEDHRRIAINLARLADRDELLHGAGERPKRIRVEAGIALRDLKEKLQQLVPASQAARPAAQTDTGLPNSGLPTVKADRPGLLNRLFRRGGQERE